jgi:hypothetical protein
MPEIVEGVIHRDDGLEEQRTGTGLSHLGKWLWMDLLLACYIYLSTWVCPPSLANQRHAGEQPDSAVNAKSRKIQIPMSLRALVSRSFWAHRSQSC